MSPINIVCICKNTFMVISFFTNFLSLADFIESCIRRQKIKLTMQIYNVFNILSVG